MNIFILDEDLKENAKYYCDQHLVKMILETAQILCTVVTLNGGEAPYKPTHPNHPCTRWVMRNGHHWDFLILLVTALNDEYKKRFNKVKNHKSYDVICNLVKPKYTINYPIKEYVSVTKKVENLPLRETVMAYRKFYKEKSLKFNMRWTGRKEPYWL